MIFVAVKKLPNPSTVKVITVKLKLLIKRPIVSTCSIRGVFIILIV